jgi:hypothetical protein
MAEKKSKKEDLEDIGKTYADSAKELGTVASDLGSRAVGKVKEFGEGVAKEARNYGRLYKEGLGMKPDTPYEKKKGGTVKSASARADGCAIRGKTRA